MKILIGPCVTQTNCHSHLHLIIINTVFVHDIFRELRRIQSRVCIRRLPSARTSWRRLGQRLPICVCCAQHAFAYALSVVAHASEPQSLSADVRLLSAPERKTAEYLLTLREELAECPASEEEQIACFSELE